MGAQSYFDHKEGPSCGPIPGSHVDNIAEKVSPHPVPRVYAPPAPARQFGSPEKMIQNEDSISTISLVIILVMVLLPCVGGILFMLFSKKNPRLDTLKLIER